jgi:hypothetical protein
VLEYAHLTLELAGRISGHARVVRQWEDVPESSRSAARDRAPTPLLVRLASHGWDVSLFTLQPGFYGPLLTHHRLIVDSGGQPTFLRTVVMKDSAARR